MRAPFQILAIPYKKSGAEPLFCVLRRADNGQRQFVAGGGEDAETPEEAARREIFEEIGQHPESILRLASICSIPTDIFPDRRLYGWAEDTYVVPEYAFAFECRGDIRLSPEHSECAWLPYGEARSALKWDSNRTALYELHRRLEETER